MNFANMTGYPYSRASFHFSSILRSTILGQFLFFGEPVLRCFRDAFALRFPPQECVDCPMRWGVAKGFQEQTGQLFLELVQGVRKTAFHCSF